MSRGNSFGVPVNPCAGILLMEYCAGRDLRSALKLTVADSNERLFGWCAWANGVPCKGLVWKLCGSVAEWATFMIARAGLALASTG